MKDIESLALKCNVQIQMIQAVSEIGNETGLIHCFVYTPENPSVPNQYKCFTIDTGCMIDKRAKVFPIIINLQDPNSEFGYEDAECTARKRRSGRSGHP